MSLIIIIKRNEFDSRGVDTRHVYLRGKQEPTVLLNRLKKGLKTRIVDMTTGAFGEEDEKTVSVIGAS